MTLTLPRRLLLVAFVCAAAALLAGPAGRFLVVLPLLLLAPGYLIERAFPTAAVPAAWTRPTIWLGLSLSVIALAYQWATAFGLALTQPILAAAAALCAAGVAWRVWAGPSAARAAPARPSFVALLPSLALLAVFALTLMLRFVQARDLALPAWVDSVHHALLIRIAVETGQAPSSLRPYLAVDYLPYHWGYHVVIAALVQLSGLAVPQAMLWSGHVLNALHVLTCAALAAHLWRRPAAGIVAGIVVGLVSIFPAYYVSWGRYTQLAGLLVLVALAIAWRAWLRAPGWAWSIHVTLLLAGLSLIHFRVLVFALGYMMVAGLLWAFEQPGRRWLARVPRGAALAGAALALTLPWLALLAMQRLLPAVERPQELVGASDYNAFNTGLLWVGQNRLLVALALAAALWGMRRRAKAALEQAGWVGCMLVLANPWLLSYVLPACGALLLLWALTERRWPAALVGVPLLLLNPALVRVPYFWLITNDVVVISLFVPISVLIGGGAAGLLDWWQRVLAEQRLPRPQIAFVLRRVPLVLLTAIALLGAWNMRSIVNPSTVLATPADVQAIAWVMRYTPPDARFLINAGRWLGGADRGTDGGWWLLPLAGRWTSTPPALYVYSAPAEVRHINQNNATVINFSPGKEQEIYSLIAREHITHIYLGPNPGPLSAAVFSDATRFKKVYELDGVTIFAVLNAN